MKMQSGDIFLLDFNIMYPRRYYAVMRDNRHAYVPSTVYIIDIFNEDLSELQPGHRVTAFNLALGEVCKVTIFPAPLSHIWSVFLSRDNGKYFLGDHKLSL